MYDKLDLELSRSLKNWAAQYQPPAWGEKKLMRRVASGKDLQELWIDKILDFLNNILSTPQLVIYAEGRESVIPVRESFIWQSHFVTIWRSSI